MSISNYIGQFQSQPQSMPIPGKNQVENNAGGFVFSLDKWKTLDRFLILGTEGGTYYASQGKLTEKNTTNLIACIKENGVEVVNRISNISRDGRAPKNDQAIFALAMSATHGDKETKKHAYAAIPVVCRTGTHIFQFTECIQALRGWSRGLRTGVSKFYEKTEDQVAYGLVKYRQRNGWTHKDVLRLCHAKSHPGLFKWAVGKGTSENKIILAFEEIQKTDNEQRVIELLKEYNLPWEVLPTERLKSKKIWEALIPHVGLNALTRNLGRIASIELTKSNFCDSTKAIVSRFNEQEIIKSKLHPLQILTALKIYSQGKGDKGKLTWTPVQAILDGLEEAFKYSFKAVTPTNKNIVLALDVSGSMDGNRIANSPLTAREASVCMAMVTAQIEPSHEFCAFSHQLVGLQIPKRASLNEIIKATSQIPFGGTDCSLPILMAMQRKIPVDVFVVYTDSETWCGNTHPFQALKAYRALMGRDAKLVVVGMTAINFTIADPSDSGMLDIVGFDTATPQAISEFIKL